VDAIATATTSRTATNNREDTLTVPNPYQSIYIHPVPLPTPKNVAETEYREKMSTPQNKVDLENINNEQTLTPIPIIRMPVLIAQKDISINISRAIEIPYPVQTITNLTWRVQSLIFHILISEKRLIAEGLLIPEICYVTNDSYGDKYLFSTEIPWRESIAIEFTYPPMVQLAKETNVYTFGTDTITEGVIHREQKNRRVDSPFAELRESYFLSSEQLTSEQIRSNISLHVSATLSVDIFQMQLVSRNHF
jgi:hypothetical protein